MNELVAIYDYLCQLNTASTALRMVLAMLFGGLVGLEREHKRRPAGFRTYMLVCLGAATTMLLGQYLNLMLATRWAGPAALVGARTDVARFGAQVINGIGFLGAGTIIVTSKHEVKGLTTAAALWASACMGLAIGAGFYLCTLMGFILIFSAIKLLPALELHLILHARNINLYIEFENLYYVGDIVNQLKQMQVEIFEVELDKRLHSDASGAFFALKLAKGQEHDQLISKLSEFPHILSIEEV